jgi:enamine deaminase RidA (YjgF/YER057c/UK114 family)
VTPAREAGGQRGDAGLVLLQPEGWAAPVGYANGIAAAGRTIYVAGQIGWNAATGRIETDDFVTQARLALENVAAVLRAGGAEPSHVVRLTWFITDKPAYLASRRQLGEAYRAVFGQHFPAMSVVFVAALVDDGARVEIEATAVVG